MLTGSSKSTLSEEVLISTPLSVAILLSKDDLSWQQKGCTLAYDIMQILFESFS